MNSEKGIKKKQQQQRKTNPLKNIGKKQMMEDEKKNYWIRTTVTLPAHRLIYHHWVSSTIQFLVQPFLFFVSPENETKKSYQHWNDSCYYLAHFFVYRNVFDSIQLNQQFISFKSWGLNRIFYLH